MTKDFCIKIQGEYQIIFGTVCHRLCIYTFFDVLLQMGAMYLITLLDEAFITNTLINLWII